MGVAAFIATTAGKIVLAVVGLVLTAGIAGFSLYAMDYGVEATVIDKDCGAGTVTVQETVTRFEHTQAIGLVECAAVSEGNFVIYNIKSERIRVWDTEAQENLVWDSKWLEGNGGGSGGGTTGGPLPFNVGV